MPRPPDTSMRSRSSMLALLCALLLATTGCAAVDDAVGQARDRVSEGLRRLEWCTAAFRLGSAVASRDVEAATNAAEDLRANAPEELEDELALILDAVEDAEAGDFDAIRSQEVRDAGERVRDTARAQCDPTTEP